MLQYVIHSAFNAAAGICVVILSAFVKCGSSPGRGVLGFNRGNLDNVFFRRTGSS